jgi:hypothetical protein
MPRSQMKNRMTFALFACGLIILLGGSFHANATNFAASPLSHTIQKAPIIIQGALGSSSVKVVNSIPQTYYQVTVTEILKGSVASNSIEVRQLGGLNLHVSGAVSFAQGENVIILLDPANSDGSYNVHGMEMGKINVSPAGELSGGPVDSDRLASSQAATNQLALTGVTVQPHGPWTLTQLRNLIQNPQ